ncbi:MAG: hypothetical protein KF715_10725 [Candidatus Didemnitutus sp.]|nr:hypothetical protein [Candidatus Didemnitutus sp.]
MDFTLPAANRRKAVTLAGDGDDGVMQEAVEDGIGGGRLEQLPQSSSGRLLVMIVERVS